ncbi:hypothetical protein A3I40_01595 [Candidatus Uhrbacteria bacterium RIFCSPLOWO2_02_FULL_48_12]|uniref:Uncharacterized protein n=1 Tax=Candidatus Uhrbacteria bacterium RIFCSPLOWO2_02_FULL_48_12 TaxID=1802407 RepID=A0A1F7V7M2_9BACT|nr:MAG: hypothetical protein A3I40_01595 [Candidatus Uhrbacteria bacterium RIFCSPLOWO2_02_FULL_48_12]
MSHGLIFLRRLALFGKSTCKALGATSATDKIPTILNATSMARTISLRRFRGSMLLTFLSRIVSYWITSFCLLENLLVRFGGGREDIMAGDIV